MVPVGDVVVAPVTTRSWWPSGCRGRRRRGARDDAVVVAVNDAVVVPSGWPWTTPSWCARDDAVVVAVDDAVVVPEDDAVVVPVLRDFALSTSGG